MLQSNVAGRVAPIGAVARGTHAHVQGYVTPIAAADGSITAVSSEVKVVGIVVTLDSHFQGVSGLSLHAELARLYSYSNSSQANDNLLMYC